MAPQTSMFPRKEANTAVMEEAFSTRSVHIYYKQVQLADPSFRQRGNLIITNPQLCKKKFQGETKIGHGSKMVARHQDRLAD
jgi:hypothetical protein